MICSHLFGNISTVLRSNHKAVYLSADLLGGSYSVECDGVELVVVVLYQDQRALVSVELAGRRANLQYTVVQLTLQYT